MRTPTGIRLLTLAWTTAMLAAAPIPRAEEREPSPKRSAAAQPEDGTSGLDPTVIQVEQLGLALRAPAGAIVQREGAAGVASLTLTDSASPPAWRLRVQPLVSRLTRPTPQAIAREHLDQLRAAEQAVRVLDDGPTRYGAVDGWRLTVQQDLAPASGGAKLESTVSSWLILPTGPDTFLIFALLCAGDRYPALQSLFDSTFSTVRLQPVANINEQRAARLDAGRALLASFTPQRLRSVTGRSQWFRVFRASPAAPGAAGGERELGYSTVEVNEGPRGALNEKKSEVDYTPLEREQGLLVRVQARLVLDAERDLYADSIQTYWMTWDRSEEAWSVRATRRQGDATASEAETGIRSRPGPGSNGSITVDRRDTLTARHEPYEWKVPEVYLGQAEHWLLGHLLPRDIDGPREYTYYYYQSRRVEISQRIDRWQPLSGGGGEGASAWQLVTRLGPDEDPSTSTYDRDGRLLRQVRADGTMVVPSTPEQIRRLWDSQGLKWGGAR